jgi:cytochrome c556
MKNLVSFTITACTAGFLAGSALLWHAQAADANEDAIKQVMKIYHKAPKGVDPVCKKASDGKATPEELKKLVAGYMVLTKAKPPKGDEASWKEKTSKLLAATQSLEKGVPGAVTQYKEAVNCKACHSVHRPN